MVRPETKGRAGTAPTFFCRHDRNRQQVFTGREVVGRPVVRPVATGNGTDRRRVGTGTRTRHPERQQTARRRPVGGDTGGGVIAETETGTQTETQRPDGSANPETEKRSTQNQNTMKPARMTYRPATTGKHPIQGAQRPTLGPVVFVYGNNNIVSSNITGNNLINSAKMGGADLSERLLDTVRGQAATIEKMAETIARLMDTIDRLSGNNTGNTNNTESEPATDTDNRQ